MFFQGRSLLFRYQIHDFTDATHTRPFLVVFRQPDRPVDVLGGLFSVSLWTAVAVTVFVLATAMAALNAIHYTGGARGPGGKEKSMEPEEVFFWGFCEFRF